MTVNGPPGVRIQTVALPVVLVMAQATKQEQGLKPERQLMVETSALKMGQMTSHALLHAQVRTCHVVEGLND